MLVRRLSPVVAATAASQDVQQPPVGRAAVASVSFLSVLLLLWLFSPGDAIWYVLRGVVKRSSLHHGGREPSHHTYVAVLPIDRHHHFGVSLEDALDL